MTAITNNYKKPRSYTIIMYHLIPEQPFFKSFFDILTKSPKTTSEPEAIYYILKPESYWRSFNNFDIPAVYNPQNITIFTPVSLVKPTPDQLRKPFDLCCDPYYKSIKQTLLKYAVVRPSSSPLSEKPATFSIKPTKLFNDLMTLNKKVSFEIVELTKNGSNGSRFRNLVI